MMSKIKQNKLFFYLAAFLLPTVILTVALATQSIYPGSERTILTSDGFHQYVIFATALRNILHGDDSLFYTFTSGLGLNFYALISYYLGSFLSPLYYFFSLSQMADAVYFITLAKFGFIGLSGAFSFKRLFPKVPSPLILVLSSSFALMSFATSQLEINTWLDAFILAPLIILGVHHLLEQSRRKLYFLSLTCLFIQNYYFGYMMAIFLLGYTGIQLLSISGWKNRGKHFLDFLIVSLFAGLSSALMLLPTFLDLTTHGETFTQVSTLFTESTFYLDFFVKNLVGVYDTTKFGSIPMIYVGLLPLIMSSLFFTLKSIKWSLKVGYGLLLIVLIASFYIQPLDLFWQGMHAPNMFLHRYSWLLSLLTILLAGQTLERLPSLKRKAYGIVCLILGLAFGLTWFFREHYDYLEPISWLLTLSFLIAYAILLFSNQEKIIPQRLFFLLTLFFSLFEISLNTYYVIGALGNEWVFPTREGYTRDMSAIETLISETKQANQTFYRIERTETQTGNDSMKYNYNGISQFSSIRNTASSSTLDRLGFKSEGTNLNLRYQNNTLIADGLFAIKYNLSKFDPNKYGFTYLTQDQEMELYENSNATQLAILTNDVYKDVNFTVNTLDNQKALLNNLAGLDLNYFNRSDARLTDSRAQVFNRRVSATAEPGNNLTTVTFQVIQPHQGQLYVSLPNIDWPNSTNKSLSITTNGVTRSYSTDNTFSFFDLGYFNQNEVLTVTFNFIDNDEIAFDYPNFYTLNTDNYQTAMNAINQREVQVVTSSNTVSADYNSNQDASLFFTLPYDKGWTASVNGNNIPIRRAQNGFMVIDVPKGQGKVVLTFAPYGFRLGLIISIAAATFFIFYDRLMKRFANKH